MAYEQLGRSTEGYGKQSRENFSERYGSTGQGRSEPGAGRLHEARDYVKQKSSQVKEQVQQTAHKAQDWFTQSMDEYPIAMGAAFMILGVAAGVAIPTSKPERKYIGKTGRRVMHQAQELGSQLVDRGEEVAERAVESVRGSIKKHAGGGSQPSPQRGGIE